MALSRGGFETQFSGINSYSNIGRKPPDLSPPGNSYTSNFMSSNNKVGFFKKDENEGDGDSFYGKNFLQRNNSSSDSLSNQMSGMNLYGNSMSLSSSAFKTKEQTERSNSPNWVSGWGQTDPNADLWNRSTLGSSSNLNKVSGNNGFSQGFSSSGFSNLPTSSRSNSTSSNSLLQLQFSRSMSSQSNNIFSSTTQSSSDIQNHQQNLKLLSGQSSPRSGLLSLGHQQQHIQNSQQQQQRGVIGQMSMQGHSSPSNSPGLVIGNKMSASQTSRTIGLPPSSMGLGSSTSPLSNSNFPGFIGGQINRSSISSNSTFGQGILSSTTPSTNTSSSRDSNSNSHGNIGPPNSTGGATVFDNEFPALANRLGNSSSSRPGQSSFSFVMSTGNKSLDANQEFQIQNEDFPALPGATQQQMQSDGSALGGGIQGITQSTSSTSNTLQHQDSKENLTTENYGLGSSYEQILKDGRSVDKKTRTSISGIQTNSSGVITNIPSGMVTDQFGMIGLLTFIRAAETEPNLVTLALGSDLTTLGLNLNSTESLYHTFGSPFSDSTCKPHEIDFYAPQEYLISSYIRDKLAPIKLGRYGEDLLFYLYYTNCGDILQLAAAAELYARDWRYHKDERVWITRFPGMEPQIKTASYEKGTYYYFDPQGWRKVAKEFYVEYDKLEEKPTAQALQQQQAQQQTQQVA
uniref:CCR4-NOT transcription complex subunit 2 n=1 Tax=Hydra vulgaris TaxID=6087 RepID=T2M3N6_HYDVU